MASLKLSGVNKIYPSGVAVLYNVGFETKDKEFIVVVGGENSGKSTLLKVIAGLEEATGGSVFIGGKDMSDVDPKNRDIAMVFRSDTLYPALNVFDNIAFPLRIRKAPATLVEQRVKAAANILGLDDVLYRKPKILTTAARQRVAIARAIAREPKLYLFDEPLAGLDEKLRLDMLNVIINLQARMQGTFIYATKNLSEAMTIGTRIIVMKNGLVQQIDSPANLYDYPANAYVAFYIGSPSINFIQKVKIVKEGDKYFAATDGLKLELPENIVKRFVSIDEYADGDKTVILGLRPEDCNASGGEICGTVAKVENDGDKWFAECDLANGVSLVVAADDKTAKGGAAKIKIDSSHVYLFDSVTRLTLLERDGGYKKSDFADADFKPLPYDEEQVLIENLKPKKEAKKKK